MRLPCRWRGSLGWGRARDAVLGSRCSCREADPGLLRSGAGCGAVVPQCAWSLFLAGTGCAGRGGIEAAGSRQKNEQREWQLAGGTPFPSVVSGVSNHRHQRKGNGVRSSRLWGKLLGCEGTVIEDVDWCEEDSGDGSGPALRLIVRVRPHKRLAHRCGICGGKRPRYDNGQGRRRWRALDLGTVRAYLEAEAPRVSCPARRR